MRGRAEEGDLEHPAPSGTNEDVPDHFLVYISCTMRAHVLQLCPTHSLSLFLCLSVCLLPSDLSAAAVVSKPC